eukprot:m.241202 g.241202  ORF g.241202 m.241202 type:complete len:704 (+) comp24100_c0_seq1:72-2183(+)
MFTRVALKVPRVALLVSRRNMSVATLAVGSALRTSVLRPTRSLHVAAACLSKHEFKAETRQLLDIVASSLYSDKEVFIRELISNASDALEKLKYMQTSGEAINDSDQELAIRITVDPAASQFIIEDTGIGMSKEDLVDNLGTIARSGSKAFLNKLKTVSGEGVAGAKDSIIGQFGVGFYAGFMVGKRITVTSQAHTPDARPHVWASEGMGEFDVTETDSKKRGTKIVIDLKEDASTFADVQTVKGIIKKYSNFVGFPIYVNGEQANTVKALWTVPPGEATPEEHEQFYRLISNAFDKPQYTLQYRTDSPIDIRALLYIPTFQLEKTGMGRMEPGVSLYCRKVLIKAKQENLLPEWMRFLRGVIDSEDVPLNISREFLKDSTIVTKIRKVVTGRVLRFLADEAKARPEQYAKFYADYDRLLKEGIVTDPDNKDEILKLLLFDSSTMTDSKQTSIQDYITRAADRPEIYYLCAPTRQLAEQSPYLEAVKESGAEVLFMYDQLDDMVMGRFTEFAGKKFVCLNTGTATAKSAAGESRIGKLCLEDEVTLTYWLKDTLGADRVSSVKGSTRLTSSPVIVSSAVSPAMQRYMKYNNKEFSALPVDLEINSGHPVVKQLFEARTASPEQAKLVAEQLFDNALIAAGILDEPLSMLPRLTKLLELALAAPAPAPTPSSAPSSPSSPSSAGTPAGSTGAKPKVSPAGIILP